MKFRSDTEEVYFFNDGQLFSYEFANSDLVDNHFVYREQEYYWTPQNGDIYIEGYANPIERVEYDEEEEVKPESLEGFVPCKEWKNFRNQHALEQIFYRETDIDIPWRIVMVLGVVVAIILVANQMGFI